LIEPDYSLSSPACRALRQNSATDATIHTATNALLSAR
jgi:hypothetical protein